MKNKIRNFRNRENMNKNKKENHKCDSLLVAGTGLEPMTFGL